MNAASSAASRTGRRAPGAPGSAWPWARGYLVVIGVAAEALVLLWWSTVEPLDAGWRRIALSVVVAVAAALLAAGWGASRVCRLMDREPVAPAWVAGAVAVLVGVVATAIAVLVVGQVVMALTSVLGGT